MPAINLTIGQQGTKTNLNDRTVLDQRLRLEAPKTGNKTGVGAKQTNKTPTTSKSGFICVSQRKAVTDRGSKGCLSLETKPVYIQEHNKKDSDKNFQTRDNSTLPILGYPEVSVATHTAGTVESAHTSQPDQLHLSPFKHVHIFSLKITDRNTFLHLLLTSTEQTAYC